MEVVLVVVCDGCQVERVEGGSVGMFLIGPLLGHSDGILLGRVNGCKLGALDGDFLVNVKWTSAW